MPNFKSTSNRIIKFWPSSNSNYFYSLRSVLGIIILTQVCYVLYYILYYKLNGLNVFTSINCFLKQDINIISIPIFILLVINFYMIISKFGNGKVKVIDSFDHFFLIRHKEQHYIRIMFVILIQLL